jgi:Uma2 family endonuclease
MAMSVLAHNDWTADAVRALPDEPGVRHECVDGELLMSPGPSWPHQSMVATLFRALDGFAESSRRLAVFVAPADFEMDLKTLVQPDIFVVPRVDGRRPRSQDETGPAVLWVEVLSPGTARVDRGIKRRRYQRYGAEYWIVDLDARLIEQWMPDSDRPDVITGSMTWQPADTPEPLTINLDALFTEALGEP